MATGMEWAVNTRRAATPACSEASAAIASAVAAATASMKPGWSWNQRIRSTAGAPGPTAAWALATSSRYCRQPG